MPIRAGVLADTHLIKPDQRFCALVASCFQSCDIIIHAGDVTDPAVFNAFGGKPIYAVYGNMCNQSMRREYAASRLFQLGGFTIGLAHGAGMGNDLENSLWRLFPEADCIIYGHTHQAVCHTYGCVLFLNPGSFRLSRHYEAQGSYAILEINDTLQPQIYPVPFCL
jgi:uncharacterized protein